MFRQIPLSFFSSARARKQSSLCTTLPMLQGAASGAGGGCTTGAAGSSTKGCCGWLGHPKTKNSAIAATSSIALLIRSPPITSDALFITLIRPTNLRRWQSLVKCAGLRTPCPSGYGGSKAQTQYRAEFILLSAFILVILMFLLQVFAEKRKREEDSERDEDSKRFGMKLRKLQQFPAAHLEGAPIPADAIEVKEAFAAAEKLFIKDGLSDALSTLTPGAQNAIKAGSFLWGYENAAKYLKNAMKLAEQKGISGIEEKSREVLGSVQKQASDQNEQLRESEKIIWTFYNDALKDYQAQSSATEVMVEKLGQKHEAQQAPLSAKEAVSSAIEQQSQYPALL